VLFRSQSNLNFTTLSPEGGYRLRVNCTSIDASVAAGDYCGLNHYLEGWQLHGARFGTANAKPLMIRFGIKTNVAGDYSVSFRNAALTRAYVTSFNISSGELDTDVVKSVIIPGDTSGTYSETTGLLIGTVTIGLTAGSTYHASAANTWVAETNKFAVSTQVNWASSISNYIEIFDAGLYVDEANIGIVPPFQAKAIHTMWHECQRYYMKTAGTARFFASGGSQFMETPIYFPVQMRIPPPAPGVSIAAGTRGNIGTVAVDVLATGLGARFFISSSGAGDCYAVNDIITFSARF
jgi:hypothetical protein